MLADNERYRMLLGRALASHAIDDETLAAIEANASESQQNDEPSDRRQLWIEVALLVREVRRLKAIEREAAKQQQAAH